MTVMSVIALALLAFACLGLLLGAAGIVFLSRGAKPVRGFFFLGAGLFLLVAAALFHWINPQGIRQLFESDYMAEQKKLEDLQRADLNLPANDPAPAGEWPQWRGYHRDGLSSESGLLASWPEQGPPVLWRKPIHGGYSSVAVSGGKLYTMDKEGNQERVLCLDATTGNEIWSHRYEVQYQGLDYGRGPRATPTVHDGRVYAVGATGIFLCLDANPADGKAKVHWRHDLLEKFEANLPRWGVACSPLIEGNLVCVQPGGKKGSVAAFDRKTGELVWVALSDAAGYSSPVVATAAGVRQIICFTAAGLAGVQATDGRKLWSFPWSTMYDCNIATPIVAGNYVFLSSDYQSGCALVGLATDGSGGVKAEPIYVRRNKLMRNHHSTCVLKDGHLYGFDVGGHGGSGILTCIDFRQAEMKWDSRTFSKGSLIYADGYLIVLTQDGVLGLVQATPSSCRIQGRFQLLNGSDCWAPPALAAGWLYVRDHHEIVCLNLKKP